MTRCISCGRLPAEDCNELTHAAHDRMWAAEINKVFGPQPGPVSCCDSCQILVRAVARLAYAIGYDETGDEMTELFEEVNTEEANDIPPDPRLPETIDGGIPRS